MEPEQKKTNWKKIGLWALGGFAVFVLIGYNGENIVKWKHEREARAFDARILAEQEKLRAVEAADTYGGITPEKTIELIIAALESGDIDLASKYYYVLDQEKVRNAYAELRAMSGTLETSINFYKRILTANKKCNENSVICVFESVDTNTGDIESETLELNQSTGIWKSKF